MPFILTSISFCCSLTVKYFFSTSNNVINSIQFEINPFFFLKQDAFNIELENLEAEGGLGE